jgi:hypothetical protein
MTSEMLDRLARPSRWAIPVAVLAAAFLLAASWSLPWFEWTFKPGDPLNRQAIYSASLLDWANHNAVFYQWDLLVQLGPLVAFVGATLALAGRWRGAKISTLAGFAISCLGAAWMFSRLDSLYYPPSTTTIAGIGLILFTLLAAVGLVLELADIAIGRRTTKP